MTLTLVERADERLSALEQLQSRDATPSQTTRNTETAHA